MAKDPAFLFYPNDYIGGTMGMTFEEKGAYIELLMLQFNRGHMDGHMIGHMTTHMENENVNVIEDKNINIDFEWFWNDYDKKVGDKQKLKKKWNKLTDEERQNAMNYLDLYKKSVADKQFRKNPETFLNNKSWNDEIINRSITPIHKLSYAERETIALRNL
jgi:uncharacterized protein YdaU (DUF1376 family)